MSSPVCRGGIVRQQAIAHELSTKIIPKAGGSVCVLHDFCKYQKNNYSHGTGDGNRNCNRCAEQAPQTEKEDADKHAASDDINQPSVKSRFVSMRCHKMTCGAAQQNCSGTA